MTIAVSVKVGEGLVMAADSMSSYFDNGVLAQSYNHARKLLQLSEYPIGILNAVQYYTQLRDRLMWPIIYQGMPIQDAIDLAVYLVNVTIGHSRFAVGPPVCGGHIDVATVTSRGFRWVRRKDWVVKTDSVFF